MRLSYQLTLLRKLLRFQNGPRILKTVFEIIERKSSSPSFQFLFVPNRQLKAFSNLFTTWKSLVPLVFFYEHNIIFYVIHLVYTANIAMIFFTIMVAIMNLVAFEILIMLSETLPQVSAHLQLRVSCDSKEMMAILVAYNFGEQHQFTCAALFIAVSLL